MPRNASGVYSRPAGTTPAPNDLAESAKYNQAVDDLGNEITNSFDRAGRSPMTNDADFGGNLLKNVAAGAADTDGINVAQLKAYGFVLIGEPTVYTASGTHTTDTDATLLFVEGCGGGGGGGGGATTGAEADIGGGGGAANEGDTFISSPAASYTVTIGAAGPGGATGGNSGTAGGETSFGTELVLPGGGAGTGAAAMALRINPGGGGGAAGTGDRTRPGMPGGPGVKFASTHRYSGDGGTGKYGSGGRGHFANVSTTQQDGLNAAGYGAGGGGGLSSTTVTAAGGDGTGGYLRVWEFK